MFPSPSERVCTGCAQVDAAKEDSCDQAGAVQGCTRGHGNEVDPVSSVGLHVGGQRLVLLPDKAGFLPESETLLIADAHFGKATSFRRLGLPVPVGTTNETLAVLTHLIHQLKARRVIFLGDFLHSARALGPHALGALTGWRELHHSIELILVRGNHDRHAGDPPPSLEIRAVDEPLMYRGLALSHHPRPVDGAFVLAGHLHPCVSVRGRARERHRLPCFWISQRVAVLPAFGAFTGMQPIRVAPDERVFAAAPDRVFEVLAKSRPR
jgi:DNA ligase-associated metallophosphoesterase